MRQEVELDDYTQLKERIKCKKSVSYFIHHYVQTFDNADRKIKPYPNYPYLKELINTLIEGGNVLVEKTRQMLFSWTAASIAAWGITTQENWTLFFTSRKGSEVDNGGQRATPKSLMGKVLFIIRHLPPWLFDINSLDISRYKIHNPLTNSEIAGEASDNPGLGSSFLYRIIDEAARVENEEQVFDSMGAGDFKLLCIASTHARRPSLFSDEAKNPNSSYKKIQYHWTKHPNRWNGKEWDIRSDHTLPIGQSDKFVGDTSGSYLTNCQDCIKQGSLCTRHKGIKGKPTSEWYRRQCGSLRHDPVSIANELDIEHGIATSLLVFPNYDPTYHVIPASTVPTIVKVVGGIDWGFSAPAVIMVTGWDADGNAYAMEEFYKTGLQVVSRTTKGQLQDDTIAYHALALKDKYHISHFVAGSDRPGDIKALNDLALDLNVMPANLEKMEGLRIMRAMLSPHTPPTLFILDNCLHLQKELENYVFATRAGVQLEKTADVPDHCLVGGTLVQTDKGEIPIKAIIAGDRVLTRAGYRYVLRAWQTQTETRVVQVQLSNGRNIIGTPDHQVHTENRGYVRLPCLTHGDMLSCIKGARIAWQKKSQEQRVLSLMEWSIEDILSHATERQSGHISAQINVGPHIVGQQVQTTSCVLAKAVGKILQSIATVKHNVAHVSVLGVCDAGMAPVFNLHVQGLNEYFAAGILNLNCIEALRYSITGSELMVPQEPAWISDY